MRRFFVTPQAVQGDMIYFDGELVNYLGKVLRLAPGEQITVCTGDGEIYVVVLEQFGKETICGRIVERQTQQRDTAMQVVLYQGMPKGDKLELIIQKCTELGVSAIMPVETSRSVVHLDGNKAVRKLERWQKIAQEASQQSKRVKVPQVGPYLSWKDLLRSLQQEAGFSIIFWEDEESQSLKALLESQLQKPERVNLIIGPEGGLSAEEITQLRQLGAVSASLGKRILRTETAGLAGLSMILYAFNELG